MSRNDVLAMLEKTGGSAFPSEMAVEGGGTLTMTGMMLRDWFAGQAMLGLMDCNNTDPDRAAAIAYRIADAMLEARK